MIRFFDLIASRLVLLCLFAGIGFGQEQAKQDTGALELARSIYTRAFTELRAAKTLDDMKKLAGNLESEDWISVDRFGRTVLTRRDADRELASVLRLPPERRVIGMEIVWAEQTADRLMVVAWMAPGEVEIADAAGDYGAKGSKHRLTRGTLVRDLFVKTPGGWRRVRHDKLLPDSTVLAVDGVQRIVPPLDERHRVTLPR